MINVKNAHKKGPKEQIILFISRIINALLLPLRFPGTLSYKNRKRNKIRYKTLKFFVSEAHVRFDLYLRGVFGQRRAITVGVL